MTAATRLPLHDLHVKNKAKMGVFAGYTMPINYADGVIQEHLHTRSLASLFDISHMARISVEGAQAGEFLDYLLPIPCQRMRIHKARYTVILHNQGGIIDDLIICRREVDRYLLIVNAACKNKDLAHMTIAAKQFSQLRIHDLLDYSLLALQGPHAAKALHHVFDTESLQNLKFMEGKEQEKGKIWITRCGYTGEDGFEILVPNSLVETIAGKFLLDTNVKLAGLGARDSLRLEAGLPLYGKDLSEERNPYEANLGFAISKLRLANKDGDRGFIGFEKTRDASQTDPDIIRTGLRIQGKIPLRPPALLFSQKQDSDKEEKAIGKICSGGYAPSLACPIAAAYISTAYAKEGTTLWAQQRGRVFETAVHPLIFVPHKYKH